MVKYTKLTQIEHILKRPGMYIGSTDKITEFMDIVDLESNKIINKEIEYSPGLYKIFDEIISNAYDEAVRDKNVKNIYVNINDNMISIMNDGAAIEIKIHPKYKIYIPELIFSHLLTSSTFTENKRITAGTHGLGAKLTNVFSKKFIVEIGDPATKKKYTQIFENNMQKINKPKIKSYNEKPYVKISFIPDYQKFGFNKLTSDLIQLLNRRTCDLAGILKNTSVYWNDNKLEINNFSDYVKLYYTNEIHYVYQKCGESEIIISNSLDDKFKQISFVNSVHTKQGGKHVDHILKQIINNMHKAISRKYKSVKIRDSFIKDKIYIFINAVIENPTFSSQSKDSLSSNVPSDFCIINNTTMKNIINKLDLTTEIISLIKAKETLLLEKTDSKRKKSKIKDIPKLYDANYAGTKKSILCTLILTEGDSAKTMAISGLSALKKGNDTYGVFPLKGKLLNVREASNKQIINNNEFNNLKKIMGLNMGTTYTKDNLHKLRYGSILLMMDADVDGSHIKGLFMNLLDYYWPSLLKIDGFVKVLITPVVKVNLENEIKSFFSLTDYENWKIKTKDSNKWKVKYYKGLGTSTSREAKEYFINLDKHIISFKWETNKSDKALILAFSKKQADNRKKWLADYDRNKILDITDQNLTISDFIHKELIHFSNNDNIRSIPHMIDGLKPSQRKVLYSCLSRTKNDEIKVSQLTGYVSQKTAYHHGENSLVNTIVSMAQDFINSNNLNLLLPIGQFGSRLMGGKDSASARYIFTKLNEVSKKIFNTIDDFQLNFLDDDGFKIEPDFYIPIIPMLLINGSEGIGTGYSTSIPKFKLVDIKKSIINKLENDKFLSIHPGYEKYKGKINKIDSHSYLSIGNYKIEEKKIIITELPIGVWTEDYKHFLETLYDKSNWIKKVKNNCTETDIHFEIHTREVITDSATGLSGQPPTGLSAWKAKGTIPALEPLEKLIDILKLKKKISLTNMHCFNSLGKLQKYNSALDILKEFYNIRLEAYEKRKAYQIKMFKQQIFIEESKQKFIQAIIRNKLQLHKMENDKIIKVLNSMKLYKVNGYDYLLNMPARSQSKSSILTSQNKINNLKKELNKIKRLSAKQLWLNDLSKI